MFLWHLKVYLSKMFIQIKYCTKIIQKYTNVISRILDWKKVEISFF